MNRENSQFVRPLMLCPNGARMEEVIREWDARWWTMTYRLLYRRNELSLSMVHLLDVSVVDDVYRGPISNPKQFEKVREIMRQDAAIVFGEFKCDISILDQGVLRSAICIFVSFRLCRGQLKASSRSPCECALVRRSM